MNDELKTFLLRPIIPILICCVLGIMIIMQWAQLFLSKDVLATSSHVLLVKNKSDAKKTEFQLMFNAPFFGDYVPTNLNDAEIKESRLNVKVVGIMFANKNQDSQVIMQTANGREQIFKIGDIIPGGAMIKRITQGGVLLEQEGKLESLTLPKDPLNFEAPAKPMDFHD